MSIQKPSHSEEEYFAKQEALARHKAAMEKLQQLEEAERERLKQLHWMRCPKCGMELQSTEFRGVTIDKCFSCGGTYLDAGELETLAGKGGDILRSVVDFFRGSGGGSTSGT